ncbi:MAG: terminase large subunit [Nitrososphaerota archaeon]
MVVCAGRQTGKSTIIAAKALHFAVTRPNVTVLIVSATLRQSMLMFDKILEFVENNQLLKKCVKRKTRTRIWFTNGSKIIALPCGRYGHSLRGHTAHLIIMDEAAFMPEEVISNVVLPMISTTNGYAWMLSTPWDQQHIFWKAYQSDTWSKHHWSTDMNPLVPKEFLEEQRRLIGEERFAIEYLAIPVEEQSSFFPIKLLRSCADDYEIIPEPGGVAGYDPGGKESQAAFIVLKKKDDKIRVIYQKAERRERYTDFNAEIADFHKQYPLQKLYVDMTGLGNPILEHLQELLGKSVVEGVMLTDRKKEELFMNLKLMLEQQKIILPNDDFALLNALNAITYERTRSGGYKFGQRPGTYDDLAYALALAAQHFKAPSGKIFAIES